MINGSPHAKGSTWRALSEVASEIEKAGVDTTMLHIGSVGIRGCTACSACIKTGYCVNTEDKVNECIDLLKEADGLVVGAPVYFAGPNASACAFLDRVFYMKNGPYAFKPAAAITNCRRGGNSAAFDRLNKYLTYSQMPLVTSNYWNGTHGIKAEQTEQDEEGLQTMRVLGRNMAWLVKSLDAAKATVPYPGQEEKARTNFIR